MGLITRDKVIKRIKAQIATCKEIDSDWISLTVETGKRILELLNSQKEMIRCDECKHYYNGHCRNGDTLYWDREPDWGCAGGERK